VINSNIIRILSPLLFFIIHVIYLVGVSKEAFFNKWIDGSFTFFVALVLCNIIRARVVAHADQHGGPVDGADHNSNDPESDNSL
jgi:hypothetical protein